MAVGSHLGIPLDEYDERITTFIPWYRDMLDVAAASLCIPTRRQPLIVDLGIGSGALAGRCAAVVRGARIYGIDADADILGMAASRLGTRLKAVIDNFETATIPRCDAVVSAFALHHIADAARKAAVYRRCARALRRGGTIVIADCELSSVPTLAEEDRRVWLSHLAATYGMAKARAFLRAWAREDHYFALSDDLRLLTRAGFRPEVRWRRHSFAVIVAVKD